MPSPLQEKRQNKKQISDLIANGHFCFIYSTTNSFKYDRRFPNPRLPQNLNPAAIHLLLVLSFK